MTAPLFASRKPI